MLIFFFYFCQRNKHRTKYRINKKDDKQEHCKDKCVGLSTHRKGNSTKEELLEVAKNLRAENWKLMQQAGIDLIPSNDFSLYDQMLDMSFMLGAIPERYDSLCQDKLKLYFAMARGYQKDGQDVIAMEMTKWFDTNYHYIVPEFTHDMLFTCFDTKIVDEFMEAKSLGILTKPVLIGPVSYLLLGKEKEEHCRKCSAPLS